MKHAFYSLYSILAAVVLPLALVTAAAAKPVLMFPIAGEGVDARDQTSVNRLFKDALSGRGDAVSMAKTACEDRDCALAGAKSAGATGEIVYSSFYKLGKKWIFSATILNADGSNSFNQRLTAASIEDMEAVTVRMADALLQRKTSDQAASVDNITAKESEEEPERRRSLYQSGIAVGYMFPVGSSFQYLEQSSFGSTGPRVHDYDQMIRLTWLNTWEFRNNLQLGTDIVWNVPTSIGADASLRYLFSRGDFTPFVGGGLGLHYVKGDEGTGGDKRNSGPTLNAQGGMFMFRTYDVNVMLRGQYQVILNSDVDHGVAVDVGVTFGDKSGGKNSNAKSDDGWSTWEYIGAGVMTMFVIGLLAGN